MNHRSFIPFDGLDKYMDLRICSMVWRAVFLSFIAVGCTGLAAILLPLILTVSDFERLNKGNFAISPRICTKLVYKGGHAPFSLYLFTIYTGVLRTKGFF
jgi:hypothetical protein